MVITVLTPDMIDTIPEVPSLYSISCSDPIYLEVECRHIGYSENLRESIKQHFDPGEPDIDLRYLMLFCKTKLLHYKLQENGIPTDMRKKMQEWKKMFRQRKRLIWDKAPGWELSFIP